jgi:hypothetical protein
MVSSPPPPPIIIAPQTVVTPIPFLSQEPPHPDSRIEVDTKPSEYRLTARLPGFSRDGIVLATKKKRVLHVVADSWEHGGGGLIYTSYSCVECHFSSLTEAETLFPSSF